MSTVEIEAVRVDYMQEGDSCGPPDAMQTLTVETQDAGAGPYLVISTTRWAIERPEDLLPLLRRVLEVAEAKSAAGEGAQSGSGACCIECDSERRRALPWPEGLSRQMIVCPHCGSKRCPRAQSHDSACNEAANPLPPTR